MNLLYFGAKNCKTVVHRRDCRRIRVLFLDADYAGVTLVHDKEKLSVALPSSSNAHYYYSGLGYHDIKFTNSRHFVLAGSFMTYCLCQTLRDTIRGTDTNDPVQFDLVQDAILEQGITKGASWSRNDLRNYEKVSPTTYRWLKPEAEIIEKALNEVSDQELSKFIRDGLFVFGENYALCHAQASKPEEYLTLKNVSIEIRRRGAYISTIGTGKKLVVFNFVQTKDILESQNPIGAPLNAAEATR